MYNRENVYIHNNKRVGIAWYQFTHKGKKSVVIKEAYTEGPSLTNSIEGAIERILYIIKEPAAIYQDCGDEGIFQLYYYIDEPTIAYDDIKVKNVSWHYFSKDLTSLELLYAQ